MARAAALEVLSAIFDESDDTYADLGERWEAGLNQDEIARLMALFLAESIFQMFLSDLSDRIEARAISATEAARIEVEVRGFVVEMVRFEFEQADPLSLDWLGRDGEELIDRNLSAALDQLEG